MKKTFYLCLCALFSVMLFASKANAQYHITSTNIYPICDSATFYLATDATAGITLDIHFGDGTSASPALYTSTLTTGYCYFSHQFPSSGVYTIKYIMLHSGSPVDSVTVFDTVGNCQTASLTPYLDNNSNCVYDAGDDLITVPYTIEVDSAGVFIKNITATSIYNLEIAPSGTIYTYKLITAPAGATVSCPVTGLVYDTMVTGVTRNHTMGFTCSGSGSFDLAEIVNVGGPGRHAMTTNITVTNGSCTPHAATLVMTFSPKYNFYSAYPTPASVVGNVVTWNFSGVSLVTPQFISAHLEVPGTWLVPGDTIHSSYVLTPKTGDADTTNNEVVRVDTVKSSYDPNEKSVTPDGIVAPGTKLDYKIVFENTGNAPAANIHIQDTLSNNLDMTTFKLESSSFPVYTSFAHDYAGHNVVKFDFQGINLLDSSHHNQCDGMVTFTIKAKAGLASGTKIDNRAGIYFDANDVVMTNTAENTIGIPTGVAVMTTASSVAVFPNPVNDILTVTTEAGTYSTINITNSLGQVVISQSVSSKQTKVDVKSLPSGMYYVTLRGESGVKVQKFEKL